MSYLNAGTGLLSTYNSLTDKHLAGYFNNTRIRRHLQRVGLITRSGRIVPDKEYRLKLVRRDHQRHVRECLAQAIFHKVLDMERHHQIEIKRKLEDFARRDRVTRIKVDRSKRYDEEVIPLRSPKPPSGPRVCRKQPSVPEGEHSESSESPGCSRPNTAPGKMQRPHRLQPISRNGGSVRRASPGSRLRDSSDDTEQLFTLTKQLGALQEAVAQWLRNRMCDRVVREMPHIYLGWGTAGVPLSKDKDLRPVTMTEFSHGVSPYQLPIINNYITPVPPSTKRTFKGTANGMKRGRRLRPTTAPTATAGATEQLDSKLYRTSVHSNVSVTMVYYGKTVHLSHDDMDMRDEVKVFQQHCGGENLCVYKGRLMEGEAFLFVSKRHRGFPFSLTFFLNGLQVDRLSSCCEFKHRKGSRLGGRYGYFGFSTVDGASPCYKCIIAMGLDKRPTPPKRTREEMGSRSFLGNSQETADEAKEVNEEEIKQDSQSHLLSELGREQVEDDPMETEAKDDDQDQAKDDYDEDFEADDERGDEDTEEAKASAVTPPSSSEKREDGETLNHQVEDEGKYSDNEFEEDDKAEDKKSPSPRSPPSRSGDDSNSEAEEESEAVNKEEVQSETEMGQIEERLQVEGAEAVPSAEKDQGGPKELSDREDGAGSSTPPQMETANGDPEAHEGQGNGLDAAGTEPSNDGVHPREGKEGGGSGSDVDSGDEPGETETAESVQEKLVEAIMKEGQSSSEPELSDTSSEEEDLPTEIQSMEQISTGEQEEEAGVFAQSQEGEQTAEAKTCAAEGTGSEVEMKGLDGSDAAKEAEETVADIKGHDATDGPENEMEDPEAQAEETEAQAGGTEAQENETELQTNETEAEEKETGEEETEAKKEETGAEETETKEEETEAEETEAKEKETGAEETGAKVEETGAEETGAKEEETGAEETEAKVEETEAKEEETEVEDTGAKEEETEAEKTEAEETEAKEEETEAKEEETEAKEEETGAKEEETEAKEEETEAKEEETEAKEEETEAKEEETEAEDTEAKVEETEVEESEAKEKETEVEDTGAKEEETEAEKTGAEATGAKDTGAKEEETEAEKTGAEETGAEETEAKKEETGAEATGAKDTGPKEEETEAEKTGAEKTGAEATGAEETGAEETEAKKEETGAEATGAEETGAKETRAEDTGAKEEETEAEETGAKEEETEAEDTGAKEEETGAKEEETGAEDPGAKEEATGAKREETGTKESEAEKTGAEDTEEKETEVEESEAEKTGAKESEAKETGAEEADAEETGAKDTEEKATGAEKTEGHREGSEAHAEDTEPQVEVSEAQAEVTATQAEVTEPQSEVTQTQAEVTQAEVTQTQAEVMKTQAEVTESQEEVTEPQSEVTQTQAEVTQAEVTQTQAEVMKTQAEVTEPQSEVTQTQAEVTQAELTQTQAEVMKTQAEVTEPQSEVTQTQAEVTQAELTQTQAEVMKTQAEVTESQEEVTETQADVTQIQAAMTETQAEVTVTQADVTETQEEVMQTQAEVIETQAEVTQTQTKVSEAEKGEAHTEVNEEQAEDLDAQVNNRREGDISSIKTLYPSKAHTERQDKRLDELERQHSWSEKVEDEMIDKNDKTSGENSEVVPENTAHAEEAEVENGKGEKREVQGDMAEANRKQSTHDKTDVNEENRVAKNKVQNDNMERKQEETEKAEVTDKNGEIKATNKDTELKEKNETDRESKDEVNGEEKETGGNDEEIGVSLQTGKNSAVGEGKFEAASEEFTGNLNKGEREPRGFETGSKVDVNEMTAEDVDSEAEDAVVVFDEVQSLTEEKGSESTSPQLKIKEFSGIEIMTAVEELSDKIKYSVTEERDREKKGYDHRDNVPEQTLPGERKLVETAKQKKEAREQQDAGKQESNISGDDEKDTDITVQKSEDSIEKVKDGDGANYNFENYTKEAGTPGMLVLENTEIGSSLMVKEFEGDRKSIASNSDRKVDTDSIKSNVAERKEIKSVAEIERIRDYRKEKGYLEGLFDATQERIETSDAAGEEVADIYTDRGDTIVADDPQDNKNDANGINREIPAERIVFREVAKVDMALKSKELPAEEKVMDLALKMENRASEEGMMTEAEEAELLSPETLMIQDGADLVTSWVNKHRASRSFQTFIEPEDDLKDLSTNGVRESETAHTKEFPESEYTGKRSDTTGKQN